jgi:hypothetical protein
MLCVLCRTPHPLRHLAAALNGWLVFREGTLPRSLAIDGKAIGKLKGEIITLCHHASGAPVAACQKSGQ